MDTARVAPVSSKPPPPKPPSTYSSDKPAEKGAVGEKGKPEEVQTQKGAAAKERIPKENMVPKDKKPSEIPDGERHCRKREKRIATLQRVDILRRQREKRTAAH